MSTRNQNNMPENWTPPFPAWVAQWPDSVLSLVTAVFAVQGSSSNALDLWASNCLSDIDNAPDQFERASYIDQQGVLNSVYIGYWRNERYQSWWSNTEVSSWWSDRQRMHDAAGYWREVFTAPLQRMETLYSSDELRGIGLLTDTVEGPIMEHAYAGGARDRIPLSKSESLRAYGEAEPLTSVSSDDGKRIRVTVPSNMCVIRSGQDWSYCDTGEADYYLQNVAPTLKKGMDFLSNNPQEARSYCMRLMQNSDTIQHDRLLQKTFGLGYARDIYAFEEWAKNHPTHLAILSSFMAMVKNYGDGMQLRLWHEVSVLEADSCDFEYINCHSKSGLLPYC